MGSNPKLGAATIKMLIGGEWREGAKTYEVRDPYRGEVIARAPESSLQDLNDALSAATAAKAKAAASLGFARIYSSSTGVVTTMNVRSAIPLLQIECETPGGMKMTSCLRTIVFFP